MRGEGSDAGSSEVVAQKGEGGLGKNTLGEIHQETVGFEDVQNGGEVREVRGEVRTGHQNVIQVDEDKRKIPEKVIHEPLKCLGSIAETEWHFGELEKPEGSDNGGFRDIRGSDRNLVVTLHQVQFGENCGAMETGGQVVEVGKRIVAGDGLEVKAAVVAARLPGAIGLGHKMERRSPRAAGATNDASGLKLGEVRLSLMQAVLVQAASLGKGGGTGGGNVMLNAMGGVRGRNF